MTDNPTIHAALMSIHAHGTEQTLTRLTKPDTLTIPQLAPIAKTYAAALEEAKDQHTDRDPDQLTATTIIAAMILGMAIHAHHREKSPTRDPIL